MMKLIVTLVLMFNLQIGFTKSPTLKQINSYVSWVDSLRQHKKLTKFSYLNMSRCSGGLDGYYFNEQLVYMSSVYGAEAGYSSQDVYLKGDVVYKIRYREHFAEWEKHHQNYPNDEDYKNMTYSDTLYTVFYSSSPLIYKTAGKKLIKTYRDNKFATDLRNCAVSMRKELSSDDIKRIKKA